MLSLVFVACHGVSAQGLQALDAQNNLLTAGQPNNFSGLVRTFNNSYRGVKGRPFLNESWHPGVIILENGDSVVNVGLNYDAYYDELSYIKREQDTPLFLPQQQVKAFYIKPGDVRSIQYFEKREMTYKNKDLSGFIQVLAQRNSFEIVRKYRTTFLVNQASGAYKTQLYDEFAAINQYFIIKDGKTKKLPKKPVRLAKALGFKGSIMWNEAYKQQWDLNKHEDFMAAIRYFIQLHDSGQL
jgi:hypothetical protein